MYACVLMRWNEIWFVWSQMNSCIIDYTLSNSLFNSFPPLLETLSSKCIYIYCLTFKSKQKQRVCVSLYYINDAIQYSVNNLSKILWIIPFYDKRNKKMYQSSDALRLIFIYLFLFFYSIMTKNLEPTHEYQLCVIQDLFVLRKNLNILVFFSLLYWRLKSSVIYHYWGKHSKFSSLIFIKIWIFYDHFDHIHLVLVVVSKIKIILMYRVHTNKVDYFKRSHLSWSYSPYLHTRLN